MKCPCGPWRICAHTCILYSKPVSALLSASRNDRGIYLPAEEQGTVESNDLIELPRSIAYLLQAQCSTCAVAKYLNQNHYLMSSQRTFKAIADTEMRKFLQAHKTDKDDPHKTHGTFDNSPLLNIKGPFHITGRDKDKFYTLYTNCYNDGTRLNLIEQKPSRKWPFFLDCDGKPDKTPTVIRYIEQIKLALLKAIIPATLKFAYGLTSNQIQLEMQTKQNNSTRFHVFLIRPNLVLDAASARTLRFHLIRSCVKWSKRTLPEELPETELAHFIDPIMQNQVGLRMYGSLKMDPNDTNYVQPNHPVSVTALYKYSIQPVGIANKLVTPLSKRIKVWFNWQHA